MEDFTEFDIESDRFYEDDRYFDIMEALTSAKFVLQGLLDTEYVDDIQDVIDIIEKSENI